MPDNIVDCVLTDPPYGLCFMDKKWDYQLPSIEIWKELLRICKPGSPMLCFGGSRTYHRLTCMIEDAGFEVRDCLMWIYGSGFPKSHNFGRSLGEEWHGYGTALKPAYQPILLAMKTNDGTFSQNAEEWGVAGINIDECRKGRWPANIILDEKAAEILDEQSGFSKSSPNMRKRGTQRNCYGKYQYCEVDYPHLNDLGGASRFFYCAKASTTERNKGCDQLIEKNIHPTVKPQKLLQYLLKLIMCPNPNAVVIDPFAGSGSTLVAAKELGYNAIGIEKEKEYVDICNARISS